MAAIIALMKPLSFGLIIVGTFLLKQKGFFREGDDQFVTKLIFKFTLPCAIIQAFSAFQDDLSLLLVTLFGFLAGIVTILLSMLLTHRMSDERKAFYIIDIPGFNIGCFALPVVQAFFPAGALFVCMFDIGNGAIVTGISYMFASTQLKNAGEKESMKDLFLRLFKSIPFDTNLAMLGLALLGISVPESVLVLTQPFSSANAFLCMVMLGLTIQPSEDQGGKKDLVLFLAGRLLVGAALTALIWLVLPFSAEVRTVLTLVMLAPASALAPYYNERCGFSPAKSGTAVFLSVLVSMALMSVAAFFLGAL